MELYDWSTIPAHEAPPGVVRRGFVTPHVLLVHHTLAPGVVVAEHRHPFEQVVSVLQGELVYTVDGHRYHARGGMVLNIPPDALHGAEVVGSEPAVTIAVFAPPRGDYAHLTHHQQR